MPRDLDIADSPLSHLPGLMFARHDHALITAFVERWQPETNSFHLPDGEYTITLEDVHHILRIPCEGDPVRFILPEGAATVQRLGALRQALLPAADGGTTYNLEELWGIITDPAVDRQIREAAYLGYVAGSTLFIDKTATKVLRSLVEMFADGEKGRGKAWGAAALTFLYRQLGIASRVGTASICGCLTLLEVQNLIFITNYYFTNITN